MKLLPAEVAPTVATTERRAVHPGSTGRDEATPARAPAWLLCVGGLLGTAASLVLAIEKYALLVDPAYVPTCSLNPVLSCGSVIASPQAAAFGFPNPLLGVAGFPVVTATGAALLGGARLSGWFWSGLQAGVTAAVVFAHWLIFSSLYRIGALCPYCMVVWAVTIPVFWYVTMRNLGAIAPQPPGGLRRALAFAEQRSGVILTIWFLAIAAAIVQRFWLYWSSLVG
jgi:uncharacterized membrane protein